MASKEFRRPERPMVYTTKAPSEETETGTDPLFDHDWEVFVVRRDAETGTFATQTAWCEDFLEIA